MRVIIRLASLTLITVAAFLVLGSVSQVEAVSSGTTTIQGRVKDSLGNYLNNVEIRLKVGLAKNQFYENCNDRHDAANEVVAEPGGLLLKSNTAARGGLAGTYSFAGICADINEFSVYVIDPSYSFTSTGRKEVFSVEEAYQIGAVRKIIVNGGTTTLADLVVNPGASSAPAIKTLSSTGVDWAGHLSLSGGSFNHANDAGITYQKQVIHNNNQSFVVHAYDNGGKDSLNWVKFDIKNGGSTLSFLFQNTDNKYYAHNGTNWIRPDGALAGASPGSLTGGCSPRYETGAYCEIDVGDLTLINTTSFQNLEGGLTNEGSVQFSIRFEEASNNKSFGISAQARDGTTAGALTTGGPIRTDFNRPTIPTLTCDGSGNIVFSASDGSAPPNAGLTGYIYRWNNSELHGTHPDNKGTEIILENGNSNTIPRQNGTLYFLAVDGAGNDSGAGSQVDPCAASSSKADLVISQLTLGGSSSGTIEVAPNTSMTVAWATKNQGGVATTVSSQHRAWVLTAAASTSSQCTSANADASGVVGTLASNATDSETKTLTAPALEGDYKVFVCTDSYGGDSDGVIDESNETNNSRVLSFTVKKPASGCTPTAPTAAPTLRSPANNSTGIAPTGVNLDWDPLSDSNWGTECSSAGTRAYRYYLDTVSNPALNNATTQTVAFSGRLANNTKYYWKVRAVNRDGREGPDSPIWNFTTSGVAPVTSLSGACNSSGNQITWSWTPTTNNNYRLQIGTSGTRNTDGSLQNPNTHNGEVGSVGSKTVSVTPGTTYYAVIQTKPTSASSYSAWYPTPNTASAVSTQCNPSWPLTIEESCQDDGLVRVKVTGAIANNERGYLTSSEFDWVAAPGNVGAVIREKRDWTPNTSYTVKLHRERDGQVMSQKTQTSRSDCEPLADLEVTAFSLNKTIGVTPAETLMATVTIKNSSPTNIGFAFYTALYPHLGSSPNCGVDPIPLGGKERVHGSLAGGASWTFSVTFNAPNTLGSYKAWAFTDYWDDIPEQGGECSGAINNKKTADYTVANGTAADYSLTYSVGAEGISVDPGGQADYQISINPVACPWSGSIVVAPRFQVLNDGGYFPVVFGKLADVTLTCGGSVTRDFSIRTKNNIPRGSTYTIRVTSSSEGLEDKIADTTLTVNGDAWLKTTGSDIFSQGPINNLSAPPPAGQFNGDWLINSSGNISNRFRSRSGWIAERYNRSGSTQSLLSEVSYDSLWKQFGQGKAVATDCHSKPVSQGIYLCNSDAQIAALGLLAKIKNFFGGFRTGPPVTTSVSAATGLTAVVYFINGDLTIDQNLDYSPDTVPVFIVRGKILIKSEVVSVDGYLITDLGIDTAYDSDGTAAPQLIINGGVALTSLVPTAVSDATSVDYPIRFHRQGGSPAEVINYDPRVLIGLSDVANNLLGNNAILFQETSP